MAWSKRRDQCNNQCCQPYLIVGISMWLWQKFNSAFDCMWPSKHTLFNRTCNERLYALQFYNSIHIVSFLSWKMQRKNNILPLIVIVLKYFQLKIFNRILGIVKNLSRNSWQYSMFYNCNKCQHKTKITFQIKCKSVNEIYDSRYSIDISISYQEMSK